MIIEFNRFYKKLEESLSKNFDEFCTKFILSGINLDVFLGSWDQYMDYLESIIDDFDSKGELLTKNDYLKLSTVYFMYAFLEYLNERDEKLGKEA